MCGLSRLPLPGGLDSKAAQCACSNSKQARAGRRGRKQEEGFPSKPFHNSSGRPHGLIGGESLLGWGHLSTRVVVFQDHRSDRAGVLSALTKAVKQVPQRDSLIVAGDFNDSDTVACRLQNGTAGRPEARRGQLDKLGEQASAGRAQHLALPTVLHLRTG